MLPFTMFYAKITSLLALDSCYKGIFSSYINEKFVNRKFLMCERL